MTTTAKFDYPAGVGLDNPGALGAALGAFLKRQEFNARKAIAGLPARWVLVRPRKVPRADPQSMLAMLRIDAERDRAGEGRAWVTDFVDQHEGSDTAPILLVSAAKAQVDAVDAALRAAGLEVVGVTVTSLAIARSLANSGGGTAALLLTAEAVELAMISGGVVESVAPMSASASLPPNSAALAPELRRAISLRPGGGDAAITSLRVTDEVGVDDAWLRELSEQNGLPVSRADESAAALLSTADDDAAFVNFLQSRLAERAAGVMTRRRVWAAVVAVALVAAAGIFAWDWASESSTVGELTRRLDDIAAPVAAAREQSDRVRTARGWRDLRPPMLACARAVALAFPDDGVWATSLAVREEMTGSLSGKARDEKVVLDLLDRMKSSGSFADVKLSYLREADRRTRVAAFAVSFRFIGKD